MLLRLAFIEYLWWVHVNFTTSCLVTVLNSDDETRHSCDGGWIYEYCFLPTCFQVDEVYNIMVWMRALYDTLIPLQWLGKDGRMLLGDSRRVIETFCACLHSVVKLLVMVTLMQVIWHYDSPRHGFQHELSGDFNTPAVTKELADIVPKDCPEFVNNVVLRQRMTVLHKELTDLLCCITESSAPWVSPRYVTFSFDSIL